MLLIFQLPKTKMLILTDLDATVVTITEVHVKASDLTSDEEEEEAAE